MKLAMIRVVTADEAATIDAAAIASGAPSFELMRAAGERATNLILARFADRLANVVIFSGLGNNGGDGWIVAAVLALRGYHVRVEAAAEPRSEDARRAAAWYREIAPRPDDEAPEMPTLAIDALLGTGARGAPRGDVARSIAEFARLRTLGVPIISLDIPSGLDATTGADDGAVTADLTITFGTMKRGLLIARGRSGAIVVLDIGLGVHAQPTQGMFGLVDQHFVSTMVPGIPAESHKGLRRRIAIVGGDLGMAGATILAARGAARSGVGMVRVIVEERSLVAAQVGIPEATAAAWPSDDTTMSDAL
ncbi:MAG: NAD(P)H-hydrate epimerase, partial [Gemmatimonadaceae bacterium]